MSEKMSVRWDQSLVTRVAMLPPTPGPSTKPSPKNLEIKSGSAIKKGETLVWAVGPATLCSEILPYPTLAIASHLSVHHVLSPHLILSHCWQVFLRLQRSGCQEQGEAHSPSCLPAAAGHPLDAGTQLPGCRRSACQGPGPALPGWGAVPAANNTGSTAAGGCNPVT